MLTDDRSGLTEHEPLPRTTIDVMSKNIVTFAGLTLSWDESYWATVIDDFDPFGGEIELHVETRDEEKMKPHALQVDAWNGVLRNRSHYLALIREGLFRFYCDIRPRYEQAGPEWIANMPVLSKKEEIDVLLHLNYISIRWPYDEETPSIGFSYRCEWDPEHGAGIILKGDAIIDVGGADCLLCS